MPKTSNEPTIVQKARKIVIECDATIADVDFWNANNPHERPIDVEQFRVTRAQAMNIIKQFERRSSI